MSSGRDARDARDVSDATPGPRPASRGSPSTTPDPVVAEAALLALAGGGLEDLHDQIIEMVAARSGADVVALVAVRPADREISVLAHHGLRHSPDGLIGTGADLKLVAAEQVALTPSMTKGSGAIAALLHLNGQRRAVAAGLGRQGITEVLVAARERGNFPPGAAATLAGVARVLTSVERSQRVAELADRRLRQQTAVAALGRGALGGGEELGELARAACDAAAANLDADIVAVLERGPDGLVPSAGVGCPPESLARELAFAAPLSARAMRRGEALVVPDVRDDPEVGSSSLATGSVLIVPIRTGTRMAGVLSVVSRRPVSYSDDDVTFVRGLSNVLALASERARVQAQLRLSVDELRKSAEDRSRLLAHIVQAQEEERQRIADDIHDDSVQVMTAVALRLATLRRRLATGDLDPLLLSLEHDVRQSINRLRRLMFVLRPPALEAHGIAAALQAFLAQVAEDAGLEYSLDDRLQIEPEPEARTVVYRIAQEAVSNVCKHARASRVDVGLSEYDGGVLVEIKDDGVGFDATASRQAPPGHLGLLVMRERAEQTGGWCTVESEPGLGTTVRYCVGSRRLSAEDRPADPTGDGCGAAVAPSVAS
jgi:signal transduction histidine kinase